VIDNALDAGSESLAEKFGKKRCESKNGCSNPYSLPQELCGIEQPSYLSTAQPPLRSGNCFRCPPTSSVFEYLNCWSIACRHYLEQWPYHWPISAQKFPSLSINYCLTSSKYCHTRSFLSCYQEQGQTMMEENGTI